MIPEEKTKEETKGGLARLAPAEVELPKAEPQPVQQPKSFYSQFVEMTTPPITVEEQARRQKAATARQGIQALGNAMSALSNLTFTGMGAPSQALPTQEVEKTGAQITSWQDKLKAEREKYQAAGLNAMAKDYEIAYRAAKDKEARELADRNYTEQVRQFNEKMKADADWKEYQKGQKQIENQHRERSLQIQQQNADTQTRSSSATSGKNEALYGDKVFLVDGKAVSVPRALWETQSAAIYNSLPDHVKEDIETKVKAQYGLTEEQRGRLKLQEMQTAVMMHQNDPNVRNAIIEMAGIGNGGTGTKKGNPMDE